jgi:hypothetical protein
MKKQMTLAFLLSLVFTAGVEGSGHNAKYLPASLAQLLNGPSAAKFTNAQKLWAAGGDLLEGATADRKTGEEAISSALSARYTGATITLEAHQAWPGEENEGAPTDLSQAPGIQFVSWIYRVQKDGQTRYEFFTAIAQRKHVNPSEAPVDKTHPDQYRFLTVRLLPRPEPPAQP